MPEEPTEHPNATALRLGCQKLEAGEDPEAIEQELRQRLPASAAGSVLQARLRAALAGYESQRTGEFEEDGQLALSAIGRALGAEAPTIRPASIWKRHDPPEAILWRDYGHEDGSQSPVLSVGEVCLLSAAGGLGKSTITVALAAAAAMTEDGMDYGAACGLRVRGGPTVLLSYEDSPARVAARLRWYGDASGPVFDRVHLVEDPVPPLWEAPQGHGAGERCAAWTDLWEAIRETDARLVVIDPASAACLAPVAEAPAVRAFLSACMAEAQPSDDGWPGCGVLIVAHSTKMARDALQQGADPGAGVVAGSAAWYDAARGVLTLYRGLKGAYLLHCVKSNYGQVGWGHELHEQYEGPAWRGLRAKDPGAVNPDGVEEWRKKHKRNPSSNSNHRDRKSDAKQPKENGDDEGNDGDDGAPLTPEEEALV